MFTFCFDFQTALSVKTARNMLEFAEETFQVPRELIGECCVVSKIYRNLSEIVDPIQLTPNLRFKFA